MLDALVARSLIQSFMAYEARRRYWFFLTQEHNPGVYGVVRYEETALVLLTKFNPVVYGVLNFEETVLVLLTEKLNPVVYGVLSEETVLVLLTEET